MRPIQESPERGRAARRAAIAAAFGLCVVGCQAAPRTESWWADGREYMVAADHVDASRAGAEILAAGGNAVDAAVATAFALAVVRQESCGLGGGGFMVIQLPGREPVALDFRETAPEGAALAHYLDADGRPIPDKTRLGGWAVGAPGQVAGLLHALEHYGSGRLSRAEVLAPAIRLARSVLVVDRHLHGALAEWAEACREHPEYRTRFAPLTDQYLKDGEPYAIGESIALKDLADTIETIARAGASGFYVGRVAERIVGAVQSDGGPLNHADLAAYAVRTLPPLRGRFGAYDVVTMPPPSSGGAVLLQVLNTLADGGELAGCWPDTPSGAHRLVEAMKHAFADRAMLLGDRSPDVMMGVVRMISRDRAREIRHLIEAAGRTEPAAAYGLRTVRDDAGTSHFSVVDSEGGAAACTSTVNLSFGSGILADGTGVVLNDEMDDFTVDTVTPNAFGLRQSERNLIAPGRRPLSSMTPTVVLRDGRVVLVVGASGGPRIISATLQTLLNVLARGMTADAAVGRPRLHHQWQPDVLYVQPGLDVGTLSGLTDRGHTIRTVESLAHVQAVARKGDGWRGACDPHKGGRPAGR